MIHNDKDLKEKKTGGRERERESGGGAASIGTREQRHRKTER